MMKSVAVLACASVVAARSASELACAPDASNHGCSSFCGYEAVKAGDEWICMPTADRTDTLPIELDADDQAEYCQLVAVKSGCSDLCGYQWSDAKGQCVRGAAPPTEHKQIVESVAAPIIGGQGKFKYQYMPDLLKAPAGASLVNCHGLVTDKDKNIFLTYQNDGKDPHCLIKWNPDGTGGAYASNDTAALCSGTPHGLKITTEGDEQFLYHANNNQKLTKTKLDGTIVWQVEGFFPGQDQKLPYRPTWFANPPDSKYSYLCDGYGSNNVYAFSNDGVFQNHTWGGRSPGKGPDQPHGKFQTNHGCTYDPRLNQTIVVSDRANSRFEFFNYDPDSPAKFEWYKEVNFAAMMGPATLPCNIRMYPEQDGRAIVPDLAGPVAIMNSDNQVISVVNVSVLLAAEQHKHPHDAIMLDNGDIVVATWAPGRVSYWKLLPADESE